MYSITNNNVNVAKFELFLKNFCKYMRQGRILQRYDQF